MVDEISRCEPFHAAAIILPMSSFSISATASSDGISSLGVFVSLESLESSFPSSFLFAESDVSSPVSSFFCICSRFSVIFASSCIVLCASRALLIVLNVSLMIPPFSLRDPIQPPSPKNVLCDFINMLALAMYIDPIVWRISKPKDSILRFSASSWNLLLNERIISSDLSVSVYKESLAVSFLTNSFLISSLRCLLSSSNLSCSSFFTLSCSFFIILSFCSSLRSPYLPSSSLRLPLGAVF
ncbi:hypothetical protein OGATHE_005823 [Ogataea polymorpha]|uniref:Uncharacterized protein n=1 Tax=Ogataea polymorpha TaxID=460523 RepID=A0A9P8SYJ7_9ASCO|nr:hypothetical protein OGATHE_005823 [Ogataea polymorpha]